MITTLVLASIVWAASFAPIVPEGCRAGYGWLDDRGELRDKGEITIFPDYAVFGSIGGTFTYCAERSRSCVASIFFTFVDPSRSANVEDESKGTLLVEKLGGGAYKIQLQGYPTTTLHFDVERGVTSFASDALLRGRRDYVLSSACGAFAPASCWKSADEGTCALPSKAGP